MKRARAPSGFKAGGSLELDGRRPPGTRTRAATPKCASTSTLPPRSPAVEQTYETLVTSLVATSDVLMGEPSPQPFGESGVPDTAHHRDGTTRSPTRVRDPVPHPPRASTDSLNRTCSATSPGDHRVHEPKRPSANRHRRDHPAWPPTQHERHSHSYTPRNQPVRQQEEVRIASAMSPAGTGVPDEQLSPGCVPSRDPLGREDCPRGRDLPRACRQATQATP